MQEVSNFFKSLFKQDDFRAFWQCGNWTDFHGWLYIISDLLVWSAYFVIPLLILAYALKKGNSIRFNSLYFLFAGFILMCGATFFVDAMMFWVPLYRLSALVRFITGVVSWITVFSVVRNMPKLFSLRSGAEMQAEIQSRIDVETELTQKNEQLREAESLAKLGYLKWDVINEKIEYSDSVPEILEVPAGRKLNYELLSSIIHEDDAKNLEKVIDTIFIRKFFPNFYCRVHTPGSGVKHLLVVGRLILSPAGSITAVKGTIQDVTEQRLYLEKIQTQNQRLKDIAWIQSHKVRAPVASILGLVQLFNKEQPDDPVNAEILQGVTEAAQTLDEVIKEINAKTMNNNIAESDEEHL
jgi:signal transduction histidine kinase